MIRRSSFIPVDLPINLVLANPPGSPFPRTWVAQTPAPSPRTLLGGLAARQRHDVPLLIGTGPGPLDALLDLFAVVGEALGVRPPTVDLWAARSLLELARQHKARCHDPECAVVLGSLIQTYRELVGRDLEPDEIRSFT